MNTIATVEVVSLYGYPLRRDARVSRYEVFCKPVGSSFANLCLDFIEPDASAWKASILKRAHEGKQPVTVTYYQNAKKFNVLDTVKLA
jgi:hypothetical protein